MWQPTSAAPAVLSSKHSSLSTCCETGSKQRGGPASSFGIQTSLHNELLQLRPHHALHALCPALKQWIVQMMPASHSGEDSRVGYRTNGQQHVLSSGHMHADHPTNPTLTEHAVSFPRRGASSLSYSSAYQKTLLDTEPASKAGISDWDQYAEGEHQRDFGSGIQPTQGSTGQQQSKPRPVLSNLAVRFANRSSGPPLATIVEQGSISTLKSHGSLLNVGHSGSAHNAENIFPGRALQIPSQSLDQGALQKIQEGKQITCANDTISLSARALKRMRGKRLESSKERGTAPIDAAGSDHDKIAMPKFPVVQSEHRVNGLKTFIRSIMTDVRNTSRNSSLSSSTSLPSSIIPTHIPDQNQRTVTSRGEGKKGGSQGQIDDAPASQTRLQPAPLPRCENAASAATVLLNPREESWSLAEECASMLEFSLSLRESDAARAVLLQGPPLADLSRPHHNQAPPQIAHLVTSEPRNVALEQVRTAADTFLSRSRDELAARYTPDSAAVHRYDEGPLCNYIRNPSRNASFCSTISTSYSSTILGIDLDLQHEFPNSTQRSVTPVWFGSEKPVGHEQQQQRRKELQLEPAKPLHSRSITSSALTSLLPIAAAEGIVQQSLATPQLSFYSPSGNLIQAEDKGSSTTPASIFLSDSGSHFSEPLAAASHNSKTALPSVRSALSATVYLPPARPAAAPLTTPPPSVASLPEYLRHHYKYQHAEEPQIGTISELGPALQITPGSNVRGCDGIVRPSSLTPHTDVSQSSPQQRYRLGNSLSCLQIGDEHRTRFTGCLSPWSAPKDTHHSESHNETAKADAQRKGKTLQKRQHSPRTSTATENMDTGVVAGHALQVCFCQPYDGFLDSASATGGENATLAQQDDQQEACKREAHTMTPNARIVRSKSRADVGGTLKPRIRSDSTVSIGPRLGLAGSRF